MRGYDPLLALDGGQDGFDAYRILSVELPRLLARRGWAIFEAGFGQAAGISGLFAEAGLGQICTFDDYGGIARAIAGQAQS